MGWNGCECLVMGQNLLHWVEMCWNWLEWVKLVGMGQSGSNELKWVGQNRNQLKPVRMGCIGLGKIDYNGFEWVEIG